jgi:nitric oxide reductase large subunit
MDPLSIILLILVLLFIAVVIRFLVSATKRPFNSDALNLIILLVLMMLLILMGANPPSLR